MKKILLLSAVLFISLMSVQAQDKYGHLNFGNLIAQMPEAVAANDSLEIMQATMVATGETMAQQFQRDATAFIKEVQGGGLPPVKQQERQAALEKRQLEIQNYEQVIINTIGKKRNEMLKPIVARAQAAIDEVAKENGYVMVFDTSIFGAIMFAEDTVDILPLVKTKLGIE
jgi:outer membrane protein